MTSNTSKVPGMFKRGLTQAHLATLTRMAESSHSNWWKDLLSRWVPSGQEDQGGQGTPLRLAVRDNYLNFYFKGQSVARIGFSHGNAYLETHEKYVRENTTRQRYLRYDHEGVCQRLVDEQPDCSRYSVELLLRIIKNSGGYSGKEKEGVDALVGRYDNIVDLEMALPAHDKENNVAPRIDIVALEQQDDAVCIVFWEVKCFDDSRLRSKEGTPKVAEQLRKYEVYVEDEHRRNSVAIGYVRTCVVLEQLRSMAIAGGGNAAELSPLVRRLAETIEADGSGTSKIRVADRPGIIVIGNGKKGSASGPPPTLISDHQRKTHEEHMKELSGRYPIIHAFDKPSPAQPSPEQLLVALSSSDTKDLRSLSLSTSSS